MKKLISFALAAVLCLSLFGCDKNGDLGKQTTIDSSNGYTLVQEVKPSKYKEEEKFVEKDAGVRRSGFKVTPENTDGGIKTKSDAVKIARQEATVDYNKITIYYDRTRGIWKLELSDENTVKETVYVDEDGYTLAAYTAK